MKAILKKKIIDIIKANGTYNGKMFDKNYYVICDSDLADAILAVGFTLKDTSKILKDIPKGSYCERCKYLETHTLPLLDREGNILQKDYIAQTICTLYDQYVAAGGFIEGNNIISTYCKCEMCLYKSLKK